MTRTKHTVTDYWLLLIFMHRRRVTNTASRASAHTGEASSASAHRCDQCACHRDATTTHAASQQLGWCTVDFGFSHNKSSLTTLYFHPQPCSAVLIALGPILYCLYRACIPYMMSDIFVHTTRFVFWKTTVIYNIDPWTFCYLFALSLPFVLSKRNVRDTSDIIT